MKFSPTVSIVVALVLTCFPILSYAFDDARENTQRVLRIEHIIIDPLPTPDIDVVAQFSLPGLNSIRCGVRGGIFTLKYPIDPSKEIARMLLKHPNPRYSGKLLDESESGLVSANNGGIYAYMVEFPEGIKFLTHIDGRLFRLPETNILEPVFWDVPFADTVTTIMRITVREDPKDSLFRSFGSIVTDAEA